MPFDWRFGKLIDIDDMDLHLVVPYRLRCHGAYDLAGCVVASFCLPACLSVSAGRDFFGPFFIKEKRTLKPLSFKCCNSTHKYKGLPGRCIPSLNKFPSNIIICTFIRKGYNFSFFS